MQKLLKFLIIGLLVGVIAIQFVHPAKNEGITGSANDITKMYPIPDSVQTILRKACNDCHTNTTAYPWYYNLQPVAWWLANHVNEGKHELNFSEFGKRAADKQAIKLKKAAKEVEEGEMPLFSYTWVHKDAVLSAREKKILIDWANNLSEQISSKPVSR